MRGYAQTSLQNAWQDQAQGLRQMFGTDRPRILPVVANPESGAGGVMLERLCTALAEQGCRTLVVDAGHLAPHPAELAPVDVGPCIEPLGGGIYYLAARGLPMRHLDSHGSMASLLETVLQQAPEVDVLMVHAGASEMVRLLMGGIGPIRPVPLVLAGETLSSVTQAYASIKLMSMRGGWSVFDALLSVADNTRLARAISSQLSRCADDFLGVVLRQALTLDAMADPTDPPPQALRRWTAHFLEADAPMAMPHAMGGRTAGTGHSARAMN